MNFEELLTILAIAAGMLALGAALGAIDRENFRFRWLLAAVALVVGYDALLTNFWGSVPDLIGGDWNWQGKILAIIASLAVAVSAPFGLRRSGVTFGQGRAPQGIAYVVIITTILLFAGLSLVLPNEPFDAETLAFQATLPGIDEELFYRGILLLALNEALRSRVRLLGVNVGWGALITTILFGLAHALAFEAGAFTFDPIPFAITAVPALILIWLRERTGSILWPVLLHNVANTLPLVI